MLPANGFAASTVAVVGGGIAGLSTALALHRHGVLAQVFEARTAETDEGFIISTPGNGVRAFGELGIERSELLAVGVPLTRREYRNVEDNLLFDVDELRYWPEFGPVCLRRDRLIGLLRDRLPAGILHEHKAVAGVRAAEDGVEVAFQDGSTTSCDYLVGADGINSVVRESIGAMVNRRASINTDSSWRFIIPNPGVDCWKGWISSRGIFLMIPIDGGDAYGYASSSEGGPVGDDPSWLLTNFDGYPPIVGEAIRLVLSGVGPRRRSRVDEIQLDKWCWGRIALVGDAAHATAPTWAQGAAMAAEDALVLADEIAKPRGPQGWSEVGSEYERRRRERVDHVKAMTDLLSRAAGLPDVERNRVMPEMGPKTYEATCAPLRRSALSVA